ncbi:predicted protein [Streptomyces viridochromogenes DSM 40736]|uniref:Predicted protein n=1 Tax=Streptomyces viridochromogenes (strain DSM 40736 / JCM 4977 / BCRC 1201 / Tue 494) TaxID=591159 RepID=D9XAH3_STRVT|nr:predicted protein [Streptomyces viridochromogenes DSM 40736]
MMGSAAPRGSYRQGSAVDRRALELTGDAHLGLRVGAAQRLTSWGLLGFAPHVRPDGPVRRPSAVGQWPVG